jgi:hypothetical protein
VAEQQENRESLLRALLPKDQLTVTHSLSEYPIHAARGCPVFLTDPAAIK